MRNRLLRRDPSSCPCCCVRRLRRWAAEPVAAREWRVLFVGNSLTYVNNLPATLRALAAAQARRCASPR